MRILVVEDDKDVAGFVVKGLREAGHTVEHADNGRDGLFLAASENFDAIILDRMLPGGIDGLRLLETLRARGATSNRAAQSLIRLEAADQIFGALIALSELLEHAESTLGVRAGGSTPDGVFTL